MSKERNTRNEKKENKRKGTNASKHRRLSREILHERREPDKSEIKILTEAHERSEPKRKAKSNKL